MPKDATSGRSPENAFDRLIAGLRGLGWQISGDEIADALWLRDHAGFDLAARAAVNTQEADDSAKSEAEAPPAPRADGPAGEPPAPPPPIPDASAAPESEDPSGVGIPSGSRIEAPIAAGRASGVSLRIPSGRALPGSHELIRALRPLRRAVPSRTRRILDEEENVRRIADTLVWTLTETPAPERWLDLALVLDHSPSMGLWRDTLHELRRTLQHAALFRDLRLWTLDTSRTEPVLRSASSPMPRSPTELLSPDGRRIILVASDTLGTAWSGPGMTRLLELWGRDQIVSLAHLLPERLWHRTPMAGATRVWVQAARAGSPNRQLESLPWQRWDAAPEASSGAIPVFSLSRPFTNAGTWARVVGGVQRARTAALVPRRTPVASILAAPPAPAPAEAGDAPSRVDHFYAHASHPAWGLALLFASAPLRLSVLRVIQSALLPASDQSHLAEFLFSDLLVRAPGSATAVDPESIDYEFRPEVRDLLLHASDTLQMVRVQTVVGEYVRDQYGAELGFEAVLADPLQPAEPSPLAQNPDTEIFGRIAAGLLRRLGGAYAEAARRRFFSARASASPPPPKPPVEDESPRGSEAQVADRTGPVRDLDVEIGAAAPMPPPASILPRAAARRIRARLRRLGLPREHLAAILAARTPEAWLPFTSLPDFPSFGLVELMRLAQWAAGLESALQVRVWYRVLDLARDANLLNLPRPEPPRPIPGPGVGTAFHENRSVVEGAESTPAELATPMAPEGGPVALVLTVRLEERGPGWRDQVSWIEAMARAFAIAGNASLPASHHPSGPLPERIRGKRILWVDDQPENNSRHVGKLQKKGVDVELATDTEEALVRLGNSTLPRIDLVLSDHHRSGNDRAGLELLTRMREHGFTQPVGFFAGRLAPLLAARALGAGAFISTNRASELLPRVLKELAALANTPKPAPPEPPRPPAEASPLADLSRAPIASLEEAMADLPAQRWQVVGLETRIDHRLHALFHAWGRPAEELNAAAKQGGAESWAKLLVRLWDDQGKVSWHDLLEIARAVLGASDQEDPMGTPDSAATAILLRYAGEGSFAQLAGSLSPPLPPILTSEPLFRAYHDKSPVFLSAEDARWASLFGLPDISPAGFRPRQLESAAAAEVDFPAPPLPSDTSPRSAWILPFPNRVIRRGVAQPALMVVAWNESEIDSSAWVDWLQAFLATLVLTLMEREEYAALQADEGRAEMSGEEAKLGSREPWRFRRPTWLDDFLRLPRWHRVIVAVRAARRMLGWPVPGTHGAPPDPAALEQLAVLELSADLGHPVALADDPGSPAEPLSACSLAAITLAQFTAALSIHPRGIEAAAEEFQSRLREAVASKVLPPQVALTHERLIRIDLETLAAREQPSPDVGGEVRASLHQAGADLWHGDLDDPLGEGPFAPPQRVPSVRILIAGLGDRALPVEVGQAAWAIGTVLVASGAGLIAGGWPGVDAAVTESMQRRLHLERFDPEAWIHMILEPERPLIAQGVSMESAPSTAEAIRRSVEMADAVILVSGRGGTARIGREAIAAAKLVLPIRATGGDAERLYNPAREAAPHSGTMLTPTQFDRCLGGSWQQAVLALPTVLRLVTEQVRRGGSSGSRPSPA